MPGGLTGGDVEASILTDTSNECIRCYFFPLKPKRQRSEEKKKNAWSQVTTKAAPKSQDIKPSSTLWMFNNFSRILRKKLNAHCVWRQSIIARLCHVFTHSASSALTNTQILREDNYKRQSNVRFVRHLFKFLKATRSRICLHLIISTDWWMFSL